MIRLRDAFIEALTRRAETDDDVFLLVGDLGFGVIEDFESKFPNRFLNAGVAEQNMAGMAAGLASQGFKPFIYSIANFPTFRCLEQIRNDISHTGLPVVIVSVGAGFSYGNLGYSHYALEDLAIMRALPGMRVLSPADTLEVKMCMDLISNDPRPTYLRLGKNGESHVHPGGSQISLQRNELRAGREILVLATGSISKVAYDALEAIDPDQERFYLSSVPVVKPLYLDFELVRRFKRIVTIEEHSVVGGLGSAVLEFLNNHDIQAKTTVIAVPDSVISEQGSSDYMRNRFGLSQVEIEVRLSELLGDAGFRI